MIIDDIQQLPNLQNRSVFLYPILLDDRVHKHHNKVVGFVIIDVITKEIYTISNNHPEGVYNSNDLSFLKDSTVYCFDTTVLMYLGFDVSNYIDIKIQYYLYTNTSYTQDQPEIVNHYLRYYPNCFRINELVSLYQHEDIALKVFEESFVKSKQEGLEFYQTQFQQAFHNIEKNGLKINEQLFEERFGQSLSRNKDYCYTQYNYFTITGRPSNRFGGINFAALNKEDDTRECFTTRFEDGTLVEVDFNSYHPRLIASIVDYDFEGHNVYEHLATYYSNTQTPTPEQIISAKEATFRQLYGGIQQQYEHIPFFNKTANLANYLWKTLNENDYIESPISGRRLHLHNYQDINCYTIFNYFIQMYETECNVLILNKLSSLMSDYKAKPILYTYDSILFDVPSNEVDKLINEILPQAIDLQKFPVKIKQGKTYKKLTVLDADEHIY